jgi:hypothetical protein
MKKIDIDIICPKCKCKAAFFADGKVGTYVIRPSLKGRAVCLNCGLDKSIEVTSELYYFQIAIAGRYLYARTLENLEVLKDYFKAGKKLNSDPDLDFPAVFYENRLNLVQQIEKRIEQEKSRRSSS